MQKMFALSLPLPFLCARRTEYEIVGVEARAGLYTATAVLSGRMRLRGPRPDAVVG